MMDRENALIARWTAERPMYEAWGNFVATTITEAIAERIEPTKTSTFLKLPVSYRTKDQASLLDKAFHRHKPYTNPYDDIEDKVGVRIVVLFFDDIRVVEEAITSCRLWTVVKARDYEDEQMIRPYEFDYQSLHYVVRAVDGIEHDGFKIDRDLPCEVQIRTLLQHAYSELTHDTIYKPNMAAEASVKRAAAKSMALIEATGDYFSEVKKKMATAAAPGEHLSVVVKKAYSSLVGDTGEPSPLNTLIIDHYREWARGDFDAAFARFLESHQYLGDRIKERMATQSLYRQPAVLLVYFAVQDSPNKASSASLLTADELSPIYSDLGKTLR